MSPIFDGNRCKMNKTKGLSHPTDGNTLGLNKNISISHPLPFLNKKLLSKRMSEAKNEREEPLSGNGDIVKYKVG